MKKLLAMLLAFALILALAACGNTEAPAQTEAPAATAELTPEPTPAPPVETWYGSSRGLELTLALSSDGTYTLAQGGKTKSGAWELKDGLIALDGEEEGSLIPLEDELYWLALELFLTSEEPEFDAYVPEDVLSDGVTAELFNGYWTSLYVETDGAILLADDLGDKTEVVIEAPRAALGGPLFGDVTVDMSFADGALTWTADKVSVKLQLQADGLLRMTLKAPDSDMTLYLTPTYVPGLSPELAEE